MPPAVAHELANPPARKLPTVNLSAWPFISVQLPYDTGRVAELELRLDRGEAEAITLAEQIGAEAILIDELAGRTAAMNCGLTVVGTLGILLRAKQVGLCSELAPVLDRLQQEINFFISPMLRETVLQQAGELEPPRR